MNEIGIKLLLVGNSNVGKTSIILQYIDNFFPNNHLSTIGVEFKVKKFEYRRFKVNLQIWDTSGQERFHSITNNFFRNADCIFFVYDITDYKSFEGVKIWIKEAEEIGNYFQKMLIGNKCDLVEQREVSEEELNNYSKENNIISLEISAKEKNNLYEAFNKMIELIFKDKSDEEIIRDFGVSNSSLSILSDSTKKKKRKKKKKTEKCC